MRQIISLGLLALSALSGTVAAAQDCQALAEYEEILAIVTDQFYDKTFNGLNWDERVDSYREELRCDADSERVSNVVNELLSELEASHTVVYSAEDFGYWGLNSFFHREDLDAYEVNFAGIWPELRDGTWYARFVLEGSAAEDVGVSPGDELIAVDGGEFSPLSFRDGVSILTISSDGESSRDVELRAPRQSIMRGLVEAARASSRAFRVDDMTLGYFHLWTARDLILEEMNRSLSEFEEMQVDALLLDLRGGYGGTSEEYLSKIRQSEYLVRIPKYYLIDDTVRSGKELLAGIIKRDGLGTLVGSTTAGAFLGGRISRVFDGKYFVMVAIGGGPVPGIGRIEGVGIEPDESVSPCVEYCRGTDPQYDRAIEMIRDRLE